VNFYKHHIGDYDADTSHLSWLEDMAYTRLMRLYYRREQAIPADVAQACRLVRATSKQEREAVQTVLSEFFVLSDDGWHNKRCDEEIEQANGKAGANRKNGAKGGRPRKTETEEKPTGFILGSENVTQNNLSQTPDSRLKEKPPNPPLGGDEAPVKKSRRDTAVSFDTFVERCKAAGERALSDYRPVWDYAERACIPRDFIELCWLVFRDRYGKGGARESKRYTDWRKTFRIAVEDNWLKLWAHDQAGQCYLTTQGRQAENTYREDA